MKAVRGGYLVRGAVEQAVALTSTRRWSMGWKAEPRGGITVQEEAHPTRLTVGRRAFPQANPIDCSLLGPLTRPKSILH